MKTNAQEHCKLCQNHYVEFRMGVVCKFTNQPGMFKGFCPLFESSEKALIQLSEQEDQFKKSRKISVLNFVFGIVFLGLALGSLFIKEFNTIVTKWNLPALPYNLGNPFQTICFTLFAMFVIVGGMFLIRGSIVKGGFLKKKEIINQYTAKKEIAANQA